MRLTRSRERRPPSTQRSPWRLVSVPLVLVALLLGVWGGLLRFATDLSWLGGAAAHGVVASRAAELHGALMVYGALATLISLDRANHFRRWWGWLAPLLSIGAAAALMSGASHVVGGAAFAAAQVVMIALHGWGLTRRWSLSYLVLGGGAVFGLMGTVQFARGSDDLAGMVAWWMAFLVFTIVGERVQFGKLQRVRGASWALPGLVAAGLAACASGQPRAFGAVMVTVAVYMLSIDTVRPKGGWFAGWGSLQAFYRWGVLLSYFWLIVAGVSWLMGGTGALQHDADSLIHMIAVGAVMTMVFVHAPMVFPAVTARRVPFAASWWVPLGALHVGLIVRLMGDVGENVVVMRRGADVTAAALIGFVLVAAISAVRAARTPRACDPGRGGAASPAVDDDHTRITVVVLIGLVAGAVVRMFGMVGAAHALWAVAVVVVLVPLAWSVVTLLVRGQLGVDLIALLAMGGALAVGEYLAAVVIALMLAGGNALEELAQRRARRELTALSERAPHEARVDRGGEVQTVDIDEIDVGDVVVVRHGEVVAVDGVLEDARGSFDQAALTGEPLAVTVTDGGAVMSGSVNAGQVVAIRATRRAADSTYAALVRLVEQALARKAPMVRMADRFSVVFLIITLAVTAIAWIASGDAVTAIAVLVVATPCPLILAPPVALVGATSLAARRGIIIKGAAAVERLGRTGAVLIDKTGTLTIGKATLSGIVVAEPAKARLSAERLLELAAAVERMSTHSLASVIVEAAAEAAVGRGEAAHATVSNVVDAPGSGIAATVGTQRVAVGSRSFVEDAIGDSIADHHAAHDPTQTLAHVAVDAMYAGHLVLSDTLRDDAATLVRDLTGRGIDVTLLTGDHEAAARQIAGQLGIANVIADCTPQQKLEVVHDARARLRGASVVMVGDGVNDAPALAAADVGIALGGAGATAASESAEAVILSDRVSLVADAIAIGTRARHIALQSIVAGMALSAIGMGIAATGHLPPVYGALTQEVIDLAVIANALRVLTPARAAARASQK